MIPSTELRLKTMMRALTESVMPALDPENSLAKEQAGLLMGHINAMLQQQGLEYQIDQQEQDVLTELARFLLSIAEGGEQTSGAAKELTEALATSDYAAISLATERLISAADASQSFKDKSWQPILDYARDSAARGKDWFKPMGF